MRNLRRQRPIKWRAVAAEPEKRALRLRLGMVFKNMWFGFMCKTPRWRLSGEALSYTFGAGSGGCLVECGMCSGATRLSAL
jgi:hypothetical protein